MNIEEFNSAIDNAVIDPRPRLKATTLAMIDRYLPNVPPEISEMILASRLQALAARVTEALERGHLDSLDACLADFASSLSVALDWERREGLLKPLSAATEVKRLAHRLGELLWNGFEVHSLVEILTPEDLPIVSVSLREIKTSSRTLARDFFMPLQPVGNTDAHFRSLGTPARLLDEFEQRERELAAYKARPFSSFSGPHVQPQ